MLTKLLNFFTPGRKKRDNELIRHSKVRFLHYTPTLADVPSCGTHRKRTA